MSFEKLIYGVRLQQSIVAGQRILEQNDARNLSLLKKLDKVKNQGQRAILMPLANNQLDISAVDAKKG